MHEPSAYGPTGLPDGWSIRPIRPDDDPEIAAIIRDVMTEFGAVGQGFSIEDAEVDSMWKAYRGEDAAYFVVTHRGVVQGGAGVGPLAGAGPGTCELKKMYVREIARGIGVGRALLDLCLEAARVRGYRRCYLETLASMEGAQRLYRSAGFAPIDAPLGNTGHFGCDRWYTKELPPR